MASSAGSSSSSDCEGEEQEDSSSSSSQGTNAENGESRTSISMEEIVQDVNELQEFRDRWLSELDPAARTSYAREPVPLRNRIETPLTKEEQAEKLFRFGVELERNNKLYEAVQHYKRAIQIMPDVEARIYEAEELEETSEEEELAVVKVENTSNSDDEDVIEGEELVAKFRRLMDRNGGRICQPEFEIREMHISWLPYEVILLILRWVVSSDLDATSLEQVGEVCRGLHVASRESDLWRDICIRTWGIEAGSPSGQGFDSWRDMYILRPRLLLNGCYISKTTYVRHGEDAFQDTFYKPWYLIDYYRYLRFFAEGVALMWTTPDAPGPNVYQLRYRVPRPGLGVMIGHYTLVGNNVVIILKKTPTEKKEVVSKRYKPRKKDTTEQPHVQTFHLELQLRKHRSVPNSQLAWVAYNVCMKPDQWTEFEVTAMKFPPFNFSRVKSYTAETYAPLHI